LIDVAILRDEKDFFHADIKKIGCLCAFAFHCSSCGFLHSLVAKKYRLFFKERKLQSKRAMAAKAKVT